MKTYTFIFTENEKTYILNTLAQRPYMEVAGLLAKIQGQINEQEKPSRKEGPTKQ